MKMASLIFVVGTIATFVLAFFLYEEHHRLAAAEVIVLSPFPCPSGLPC